MGKMKQPFFITALLLLFSIPAVFSLLRSGFYEPHDLHHLADIYQMYRAFESGQIPPRLGPDFAWGYAHPIFNFYYLLPFYLGALWFYIFRSLTASFEFVFVFSVVVSVLGMYLFLKEIVRKEAAIVGAILFLYTPYRAVEIYVRGAIGEALALSVLPFVAWAIIKVIKNPKPATIAIFSLLLALFLLSHNYLWLLSAPWLALFALVFLTFRKTKLTVIKNLIFATILGLGISFYWWFPALVEQGLVASITPFRIEDHFPFVRQLIFPSWGYGSSVPGPGDGMSFQIGIVNLAVVGGVLGILLFARRFLIEKMVLFVTSWAFLGFFASVFLMNIRSLFIWKILPFYQFIQFPWRLLFLTTFFTAVIGAIIVNVLPKKWSMFAGFLILISSLILTIGYFQPSKIVQKSDNEYLSRFFADRTIQGRKKEVSEEYLNYSEDYLLLPKWTKERPTSLPSSRVEAEKGAVVSEVNEINPVYWKASVSAKKQTKVIFHAYYFPGWFAFVDGEEVQIKSGSPYGQIEINVPPGEHTVEFFWGETRLRKIADLVSVVSAIILLGLFFYPTWRKSFSQSE